MALVLYSTMLFYPGGDPASNILVSVWHRASNQMALLFTDGTGTTPAPNPATTDGNGVVSFYAAPGDYVVPLAGDIFPVPIDESFTDPVLPGLWVHTQSTPSAVWTIEHHFGINPQVDVLLSGDAVESAVEHPDAETTTIAFSVPVTGVANLRR